MKILIAAEGSEYSQAALDSILSCRWTDDTEIMVLSVAETGHLRTEYWNPHSRELLDEAERKIVEHHQKVAAAFAGQLRERLPRCQVETKVVEGHAEDVILHTAEDWKADLIVLGSHGAKGISRFLLGSVSEAVAAHAHCAVRVVRMPKAG